MTPADLEARVTHAIATLPIDALQTLARLYVEGWLDEHMPEAREGARRFKCTGGTHHACSYMLPHHQGCRAIGGDGNLYYARESATSCDADCDETATEEPWCRVAGFDCPSCKMVDQLLALLEEHRV